MWLFALANLVGACCIVMELVNLAEFPVLREAACDERIDVIVAMRNEEGNARACVASLLALENLARVVVVDDGSTDATRARLSEFDDSRLTIHARDCGSKSAALAFGVGTIADRAPWLFFVDADVRLHPTAASSLVAFARARGCDAASVWLRVVAAKPWSPMLAPLVVHLILQALPLRAARGTDPRFAAGNGACFLVLADAYERCGGHGALRAVVEDVALARALKRSGSRVALGSGIRLGVAHGYEGLSATWHGLGRSLFAGAGALGCVAFAVWQLLALCAPLPNYVSRLLTASKTGEPWWSVVLAPLASFLAAVGALVTLYRGVRGEIAWRGRPLHSGESRQSP